MHNVRVDNRLQSTANPQSRSSTPAATMTATNLDQSSAAAEAGQHLQSGVSQSALRMRQSRQQALQQPVIYQRLTSGITTKLLSAEREEVGFPLPERPYPCLVERRAASHAA